MDVIGWVGAFAGVAGVVTAVIALRRSGEANEIAREALEAQRGPGVAFAIEKRVVESSELPEFRLRNAGWQPVSQVRLLAFPEKEAELVDGSWDPEHLDDFVALEPGESLLFSVGGVRYDFRGLHASFPPYVLVQVRELDAPIRVDMP